VSRLANAKVIRPWPETLGRTGPTGFLAQPVAVGGASVLILIGLLGGRRRHGDQRAAPSLTVKMTPTGYRSSDASPYTDYVTDAPSTLAQTFRKQAWCQLPPPAWA
jgi:hypothetical protein